MDGCDSHSVAEFTRAYANVHSGGSKPSEFAKQKKAGEEVEK